MAKNNQWLDWLKCNVLELVILILVLVLLVKVYSAPAVEEVPAITARVTMEEPLAKEAAPKVPVEGAPAEETTAKEVPTPEAVGEVEEETIEEGKEPAEEISRVQVIEEPVGILEEVETNETKETDKE